MTYASISIDRREAYYERAASLIARDPVDFYARAAHGRMVQAKIQPADLTLARLLSLGIKPLPKSLPDGVASLDGRRNRKRA